jgi:BlaI family transcriptional regulator, penicillinase repressor
MPAALGVQSPPVLLSVLNRARVATTTCHRTGVTLHFMKRLGRGELENQVLDVVWGAPGPVTPRQVHDELSGSRKLAYTTVMTILVRLCKKGLLEREPSGRAFAYRPLVSREERAAARMNDALTSAGDPSLALTHFVESLPRDQVDELRSVLRRARSDR